MDDVTYKELVALCGRQMAYVALQIIEGSARVSKKEVIPFDCEERLRRAFEAMRETELAA